MAALNARKRIMVSHENLLHLEKENKKEKWRMVALKLQFIKPDFKIHRILS